MRIFLGCVLLLILVLGAWLALSPRRARYCLVCGGKVSGNELSVVYRGLPYPIHPHVCLKMWEEAEASGRLDALVGRTEPRGALFQADSKYLNPEFQRWKGLALGWLFAGVGIFLALVSGGLASAWAVQRHSPVLLAFFCGAVLPGLGILLVKLLPINAAESQVRGMRIPQTRSPVKCPHCGAVVHPAAQKCLKCGRTLAGRIESEVEKAGVGHVG
jgi:DNA-directed RNA polymerase subunit RPC12/RpoP